MNNNFNDQDLTKKTVKKNVKIFGVDKNIPKSYKELNDTQKLILENRKAIY